MDNATRTTMKRGELQRGHDIVQLAGTFEYQRLPTCRNVLVTTFTIVIYHKIFFTKIVFPSDSITDGLFHKRTKKNPKNIKEKHGKLI